MASVPEARMRAREAENRAIAIAFLASIALHLLLLAAWPMLRDPVQRAEFSPGPIIARLLAPKPEAPIAVAPPQAARSSETGAEATPAPEPEGAPKAAADAVPAPELRHMARARPEASPREKREQPLAPMRERLDQRDHRPAPEKPGMPPLGAAPLEPGALPVARQAAPPIAALKPPESAPPGAFAPTAPSAMLIPRALASAPEVPDAGTLAQYRLAVIEAAKRYKRYPRVALDNNWEGRVEVRMVVSADGAIASLRVRASTGHEALDLEALEMIRQAKLQTPIPAALRGRELEIEIPVIFNLRDPGA